MYSQSLVAVRLSLLFREKFRHSTYAARAFPDLQVLTLDRGAPPVLIPAAERQG